MGLKQDASIRLFLTDTEDCSYLEGRKQRMLVVDPSQAIDLNIGTQLSQKGFRRSGDMIYRPNCGSCNKCVSVRVPVHHFKPSRNQKRVSTKNQDLEPKVVSISRAADYFDMYLEYQRARHANGIMCNPNIDMYKSFIESDVATGYLLVMRHKETKVPYSVSVIDVFADGISGVYTFFDPKMSKRSLGTNAVLEMIKTSLSQKLQYVYLGFWVDECQKMNYKTKFSPLEGYIDDKWQTLVKS